MLFLPRKECAFSGKVDKRAGDCRIVLDPNSHVPGEAEEGANVREVLAVGPVADSGDLGVVGNAAVVSALVPEDDDFGDCNEELLGGYGGASAAETMEDAVYIVKVLPNEAAYLIVLGNCLESAVVSFVSSRGPFDAAVVHKW